MVRVQSGKSPKVQAKTADVLKRHGFEEESNLLSGKQTQPLIHVPVVCCTMEPSCKGHLKASIIVSFTHTMLSHSECLFPATCKGHQQHLLAHSNPFPWVVDCPPSRHEMCADTNAEPHMQSSSIP